VVHDTAWRPIADVRVEVVDGPGLGVFAVTDASGIYALSAVFSDTIAVRASKDGYVTLTKTFPPSRPWPPGQYNLSFSSMELSSPSVNMEGDYTLTFTADRACTELPVAARTRTYQAAITPNSYYPNRYDVGLGGATLLGRYNSFGVGVAGSFARFVISYDPGSDDFGIVEELTPSTSVAIVGEADASVGASSFSASLTDLQHFRK
jgi:hypothetical protein